MQKDSIIIRSINKFAYLHCVIAEDLEYELIDNKRNNQVFFKVVASTEVKEALRLYDEATTEEDKELLVNLLDFMQSTSFVRKLIREFKYK